MKTAVVLDALSRMGFSKIALTAETNVLPLQELLVEHDDKPQTFVDYISDPMASGLQQLLNETEFVELLLHSLIAHDFPIPKHILQASSYEIVCAKDKKRLLGNVKNGLYTYIENFQAEIAIPFRIMQRQDSSQAYILELPQLRGHLTIDEFYTKESPIAQYYSYAAHIRFEKNDHQVRVYFDEKLNVVKTTAYLEDGSQKIAQVDPASLNVIEQDYRPFLEQLTQLMKAYHDKLNQLDLEFTTKMMFIRTANDRTICEQLIQEISGLKSPYMDARLELMRQWPQPNTVVMQQATPAASLACVAEESDSKEDALPVLVKSAKQLKRERIIAAEQEILALIGVIQSHLALSHESADALKSSFEQILNLEFLLIQHLDFIKDKQQQYDKKVDEFKIACIDVIYQAVKAKRLDYMEQVYQQCQHYIDSLVLGSLSEFYHILFQDKSTATDEKLNKLITLFQYLFDKNDLCKGFFITSNEQIALGPDSVFLFFASIINRIQDPNYIVFLLEKKLLSATDCVGILQQQFISLQQHIFMLSAANDSSYFDALWHIFSENKSDFLEISNKKWLTDIEKSSNPLCIILAEPEKPKKSKQAASASASSELDGFRKQLRGAKDFSYEFLRDLIHTVDERHRQKISQLAMIKDPVFAFWWLGNLANHNSIRQTKFFSAEKKNPVQVYEKSFNSTQEVIDEMVGVPDKSSSPADQYFLLGFYPSLGSEVSVKNQLRLFNEVLRYVQHQDWMKTDEIAKLVNQRLMIAYRQALRVEEKLSISLGAEIYFVAMRHLSDDLYRNLCFWQSCNLENLAQKGEYKQIDARLYVIQALLECVRDEEVKQKMSGFVGKKVEAILKERNIISQFQETSKSMGCRK